MSEKNGCFKTRLALVWMNLCSEPLNALYSLFPFILKKDLGATTFQITLLITLRPLLSVFSFYWGAQLHYYKNKLIPNLMVAWVIARIPFLFFPFFQNIWFLIFSCGIYQLFSKAGTPALIEILKRNVPQESRQTLFSWTYILTFIESALLGIAMGFVLDSNDSNWKELFVIGALLGLSSVFVQMNLEVPENTDPLPKAPKGRILQPLKETFALFAARPDFARFQWGFMIGGFSLMLISPALNVFYASTLSLSHSNMTIARFVFMAFGVMGSSLIWKRGLQTLQIHKLTALVLVGFCLFPLLLLFSQYDLSFLYLAFLVYGVAQAGSHLIWNLSGTLFAGEENSAKYTAANVLTIGIRGLVGPALGGVLCASVGPVPVLVLGIWMGLVGVFYLFRVGRAYTQTAVVD